VQNSATASTPNEVVAVADTAAYWSGNFGTNVWGDGTATNTNWWTSAAGTTVATIPGLGTDVFITANAPTNTFATTLLNTNYQINSLTFTGTGTANTAGSIIASGVGGPFSLTLDGAAGITVASGSGANTVSTSVILGASQTWTNNSASLLTVSGTVDDNNTGGDENLAVAGSGNTTISGNVILGSGTVTKSGAGTLNFTGVTANTYTGLTTVNGGELDLGKTGVNAVGGSLTVTAGIAKLTGTGGDQIANGGTVTVNGATATFDVNGKTETVAGVSLQGGGTIQDVATGGALTSTTNFDMRSGTATAILAGGVGLEKTTAGTVILGGANTYTGATTVSEGTLQLGNGGATGSISTTSTISVATGATFAVNESAAVSQGTDFIGTGSGISGAGSFAQTGSGSTTLNGSNTYTGTTTVSDGQVHLTGNLTSTSAVTVSESAGTLGTYNASTNTFAGQNAAVLSANDNVTLGSASSTVTVGGAGAVGILAPGGSLGADNGSLTISHDLVVSSGSMLNLGITTPTVAAPTSFVFANGQYYLSSDASFTNGYSNVQNLITDNGNATPPAANTAVATEINIVPASGNHDYINVAGTLTLNSGSMVHVFANGTPSFTCGEVFNVLDWTSIINNGFNNPATFTTGGATGDFYLPDLSLASSGLAWDTSAFTTYGILVVVPEPSRVLLLLFGLLGLALRRRRSAR